MSPEITERAPLASTLMAQRQVWQFVKVLTEPDTRRSDNAGRVVNVYMNASLMGRYPFLAEQIRKRGDLEPDELEPGQVIIMINRSLKGYALLTHNHCVTFHKTPDEGKLTLESLEAMPRAFNQTAGLDYDSKLLQYLTRMIEGREIEGGVRGGKPLNPQVPLPPMRKTPLVTPKA